jgi:hypothetical protein
MADRTPSASAVPLGERDAVDRVHALIQGVERTLAATKPAAVVRRRLAKQEAQLVLALLDQLDEASRATALARLNALSLYDDAAAAHRTSAPAA